MKKIIKLTESDLYLIVKRVVKESKRTISELVSAQDVSNEIVLRSYTDFKYSVSGPGTNEDRLLQSVESLSSKEEFLAFLKLFKGGETGYNSFESAINGEFDEDNYNEAVKLKDIIKNKFGISYIFDSLEDEDTFEGGFRLKTAAVQTPAKPVQPATQTTQPAKPQTSQPAKPQTSQPAKPQTSQPASSSRYITNTDTDFATTFNTNKKNMVIGSKGDLVKKVQNFLLKNGFDAGNITKDIEGCKKDVTLCDGVYGRGTSNSVRKYQTNKGLKGKDGIVGIETAKSMGFL